MTNMKNTSNLLAFLLIFASCEKVLDINIPVKEGRIVVNSVLNPDSNIQVNVSKSLHILDNMEVKWMDNAKVSISGLDGDPGAFIYQGNGTYELAAQPAPGKEYTIKVAVDGLETATAKQRVPAPVLIHSIDTLEYLHEGENRYRFTVTFKDPPSVANYYKVNLVANRVFYGEWNEEKGEPEIYHEQDNIFIESDDPVAQGIDTWFHQDGMVFSDDIFNGKTYQFTFNTGSWSLFNYGIDSNLVHVQFSTLSEDYFLYLTSFNKYMEAKDNPLAEPVSVYNNIENGYGILGGYSRDEDTLLFIRQGGHEEPYYY